MQLIEFLNDQGGPSKNSRARKPDPALVQMKEKLDAINLKPEKGRRKDLRKIEQTVRAMTKIAANHKKTN